MTTMEKPEKACLPRATKFAAIFLALIAATGTASTAAAAWSEAWVYSFKGGTTDGASPYAGLSIPDSNGNFYGATSSGGAYGQGTVFKIAATGGTPTILHSFNSLLDEGGGPRGTPVVDGSGNILGTTVYDDASTGSGYGVVYELTPNGDGTYSYNKLHQFAGTSTDGANPYAGLSLPDTNNNFYGTTYSGGPSNYGTVFEVTSNGSGGYTCCTILHFFAGGSADGLAPYAGVILDSAGNIYGTTVEGGSDDNGVVFKLLSGTWTRSILRSFVYASGDGILPRGGLISDTHGDLYGATWFGGASGDGIVFELTPVVSSPYIYSKLHDFTGSSSDGANPWSSLISDSAGNLYGTTAEGGTSNQGVVFELTPNGDGTYAYNNLYSFAGGTADGANPYASLQMDSNGNLYGTTLSGGAHGYGIVFELTPSTRTSGHALASPAGAKKSL